jgi:hypothetical protein
MRDYKKIALVYNKTGVSKGTESVEKIIDGKNGFLQESTKFIWCTKGSVLRKLKAHIDGNDADGLGFVVRFRHDFQRPDENDELMGEICNIVRGTDAVVLVLVECEPCIEHFSLQHLQCPYGTDGGLEMFFDLIIAEEENTQGTKTRILKNKCGELYTL